MRVDSRRDSHGHVLVRLLMVASLSFCASTLPAEIDFNRDVRPILAEHCWRCHGFDAQQRQAGLRLDIRDNAIQVLDSEKRAIVPFHPDESELIARITTADESLRMPPPEAHQQLKRQQIEILRQWITAGAEYKQHWSFEPIRRPLIPQVVDTTNPIDAFVLAKLNRKRLHFSPEAEPLTLLRRVSFDLTGLPPTLDEIERFQSDGYEKTVDRLLASPRFGERMAVDWLDAARYADTNGYFGDKPREIWLWRDWVINAFNANMPFDQFTIEQLAGDLLPDATIEQRIATGFNRNHMSNNETGIIEEEYRVEYVIDRLDTTMTTWLGLTVGCAQCHDHKYDPITQKEFYQLFAFFNTVPERGLLVGNNPPPILSVPTPEMEAKLATAIQARSDAEQTFEPLKQSTSEQITKWEQSALDTLSQPPTQNVLLHESFEEANSPATKPVGTPTKFVDGILGKATAFDATRHLEANLQQFQADQPWTIAFWLKPDGPLSGVLSKIEPDGDRRGLEIILSKSQLSLHLVDRWKVSAIEVTSASKIQSRRWQHVAITYDGSRQAEGIKIFVNSEPVPLEVASDSLAGSIDTAKPFLVGRRDSGLGLYGSLDELRILSRTLEETEIADWSWGERIRGILNTPPEKRSSEQQQILFDFYVDKYGPKETRDQRDRLQHLRNAEKAIRDSIPTTLVMEEQKEPRKTFVLNRGQYDQPLEKVEPGVPATISNWPDDAPQNRLGLAQWMVAQENPLTARVAVNRLWKQCFGHGLVRTMNDFGTQGELPTHPELLDYLATEFRDNGWNIKAMLRLIVTSQTYKQSSQYRIVAGETFDPENRLLSRGPSFRLPMEMIRDQALTASGLLVEKIGGPSVKPYQPPGLWEEVSYNGEETYIPDDGAGLWRRSLYTFIKRQAPPPSMLLLDGPTREKCSINRPQTNTPLQALLLLNEEIYLEAARHIAQSVLLTKANDDARMTLLWNTILTRNPTANELRISQGLLNRQRTRFANDPHAIPKVLSVGASKIRDDINQSELAAWTVVAHTVLNLDEAIVRR